MIGLIDEFEPDGTRQLESGTSISLSSTKRTAASTRNTEAFEYFDSYLVGLTATPRDQVDKNTYDLFDLETGVPTDAYSLEEAIEDRHLVPPEAYSVPLKFIREGIRYDDLSDDEKEQWDDLDWDDEDGDPPDEVNAHAINQWLFNADTVDKVLENLMTDGIKVAGGDRVGKTIVFAKNQRHAEFIGERFNLHYPHSRPQGFSSHHEPNELRPKPDRRLRPPPTKPPTAISVDMLDTGIDVPECVNLVFFKVVQPHQVLADDRPRDPTEPRPVRPRRPQTKFSVRLLQTSNTSAATWRRRRCARSIAHRTTLEHPIDILHAFSGNDTYTDERATLEELLQVEVDSMNRDNFLVRPHLENVNRYEPEPWKTLSPLEDAELRAATCPRTRPRTRRRQTIRHPRPRLQLGVLNGSEYSRQRTRIQAIAGLLRTTSRRSREMELIIDVQSDEWWENVTYQMLETARTRLRTLVTLLDKKERPIIYGDFEDELDEATVIDVVQGADSFEQFRKKAEHFLQQNLGESQSPKSAPVNRSPPPTSPTCNDSSLPRGSATTPP